MVEHLQGQRAPSQLPRPETEGYAENGAKCKVQSEKCKVKSQKSKSKSQESTSMCAWLYIGRQQADAVRAGKGKLDSCLLNGRHGANARLKHRHQPEMKPLRHNVSQQ